MNKKRGEAFIIKTQPYLEKDLILHLYSLQDGNISLLAKGAKKSRKNWGGKFLLFSKIEYEVLDAEVKDKLTKLIRAESMKTYNLLNPEKYILASFCAEVFLKLNKKNHPSKRAFSLLEESFEVIEKNNDILILPLVFLVKILNILGFLPKFSHCSNCHKKIRENSCAVWKKSDQILCENCLNNTISNLNYLEIKILSFIQNESMSKSILIDLKKFQITNLYSIVYDELLNYLKTPLLTQKSLDSLLK